MPHNRVFEQVWELFFFDHEEGVLLSQLLVGLSSLESLDSGWSRFQTGDIELDRIFERIRLSENLC